MYNSAWHRVRAKQIWIIITNMENNKQIIENKIVVYIKINSTINKNVIGYSLNISRVLFANLHENFID